MEGRVDIVSSSGRINITTDCGYYYHMSVAYKKEFKKETMKDNANHTLDKDDNVLTIPEVASRLKMSKSKIYSLVSAEKIPHIRIGYSVRIMESDLVTWLANQKVFPQ